MKIPDIHILGGGPAGLTTGYYAKKHNFNFLIYEAGEQVGGNCRTLQIDNFLFDTGAHRFHDKDPEATEVVKELLGDDLQKVDAPSHIYYKSQYYRFPLILSDLIQKLDRTTLLEIIFEKLRSRQRKHTDNFKELALKRYGNTLANNFLLNYSEKLWGEPPEKLSTSITGNRLKGLDLWSFLKSTVIGSPKNPRHLDGTFFYPKYGIGMIPDKLSEFIGKEQIHLKHRITRINHNYEKIESIILNDDLETQINYVVNTLPLTLSLRLMNPKPPSEICDIANSIKFRHLVLSIFCLNRESYTQNASLYFPNKDFPFTRLYEPKNRSTHMAPVGQTVIVLEIPCYTEDSIWTMEDSNIERLVWDALGKVKSIDTEEVIHSQIYRLPFAYPVLEVDFEDKVKQLVSYFDQFTNLSLTGRSSMFRYLHLHDLFNAGKEVIHKVQQSNI
ncbi:FAD-dependent oxidoreductase [Candidatus Poribacteria bacterium]|nr:FAD-dependent oxidoreductase [Candidatus Poribacteria bacterium]